LRIPPASSVSHPDVEVPVGAEGDLSSVVVREGLTDDEQDFLGSRVGDVGVARRPVAGDDRCPVKIYISRVVHVEFPVRHVIGRKGESQQALLPPGKDTVADVEKRGGRGVVQGADRAGLLHDEHAAAAIPGVGDLDRQREPGPRLDQGDLEILGGRGNFRGLPPAGPPASKSEARAQEERQGAGESHPAGFVDILFPVPGMQRTSRCRRGVRPRTAGRALFTSDAKNSGRVS